jgi:hypothetical protein
LSVQKKRGIDTGIQDTIKDLYDCGVTGALNIIYALRDKKLDTSCIPNQRQIYNFLYEYKKSLFGPASITFGELSDWCEKNRFNHTMKDNEAYVLDFQVSLTGKL